MTDVKLRAQVQFPANVTGGTGIAVVKDDDSYTFNLAVDELTQVASVSTADADTTFLLLWNATTDSYSRISLADLKTTLAALP